MEKREIDWALIGVLALSLFMVLATTYEVFGTKPMRGNYFTTQQRPEAPALRLEKAGQNVYPELNGVVSLTLHFENEIVDPQGLADRVFALSGVRKLHQVDSENRVFKVTFDPRNTSHLKLLKELCNAVDDPLLF
jgi:hypothetical protein